MDRVRARLLRRADVLLGREVRRDLDRFVRGAGVQRAAVVRRCDGDRVDPELAARTKDAKRDLAAVRHEQLADHAVVARSRGVSVSRVKTQSAESVR